MELTKKYKGAFIAIACAVAFAFAMMGFAPAAHADEAAGPTVTKELQVNAGSSVTETFNFTATPTQLNAGTPNATAATSEVPTATIEGIELTADGATATGTSTIQFGTFPHAGVYAWTIEETAGTTTGMQYDTQKYTLIATVENTANGLSDPTCVIVKGETTTTDKIAAADKVATAKFTNKYTESASDLTITKKVDGAQGDKTKDFEFTVTFTAPSVLPAGMTADQYLAQITCDKGTISGGKVTFTLKDGETATFGNIIAGTTYTVSEADYSGAGYTAKWAAVSNGSNVTEQSNILIGENTNTGTMTNTKASTVVTGVIMNNLPFVVLLVVACAGIALYSVARRKLQR